ncbi:DUF2141 domain-containing protein [Roseospira navarrensis]|uniref:DUF2141 domain-containing protein n=1 Tax=Roseospira navarrensis TaxID=140058 RepID=A0A7X2D4C8_9PROT|nr:DUF2141 domain-containing protein [Roseospira navarrensis]MQX37793.1 DUF2141 domain-containing protein [Roseospira navarrensis]
MRTATLAAALAAVALAGPAGAADTAPLAITVIGVEAGDGSVRADIYDNAETFREPDEAVAALAVAARPGGTVDLEPVALPPGRYAVIVYHDEDDDGDLDRFLGMMPTEGYGVSTNPTLSGPPDFDDTAVILPPEGTTIRIEMRY